ncbi:hypothetical protein B0G76_7132 [Paraburkholderia sp. BL23I1N1]|nr:hypothetical protein B0G76_7132 [Paraburkholderia sp. BL23I1N1]
MLIATPRTSVARTRRCDRPLRRPPCPFPPNSGLSRRPSRHRHWHIWCSLWRTPPSRDTLPTCEAMHTLLSTRLTRAALKAARPARRHVVRALRHHATRTRALGEQWREAKAVDGIRTWFHTFFSALRLQGSSRRFFAAHAAAQTDAAAPLRTAQYTGRSAAKHEPPAAPYVDERQHRLVCVRVCEPLIQRLRRS